MNMEFIREILKTADAIYAQMGKLDHDMFWAMLGLMIDRYAAEHCISYDDTHAMLENLLEAHEEVHSALGEMQVPSATE